MVIEGRFDVRLIDQNTLKRYMEFRGFTIRTLGEAVDREVLRTTKRKHNSRPVIGHLRSGERNTCQPWTAVAIEKVLECPPGSLFVPRVSHVSRARKTAA